LKKKLKSLYQKMLKLCSDMLVAVLRII